MYVWLGSGGLPGRVECNALRRNSPTPYRRTDGTVVPRTPTPLLYVFTTALAPRWAPVTTGVTPKELQGAGFGTAQLREGGFTVPELKKIGSPGARAPAGRLRRERAPRTGGLTADELKGSAVPLVAIGCH